ncbi:MAG TPA: ABC transporter permease [bacterium]|nr:ABC transporter permease [bacterium]
MSSFVWRRLLAVPPILIGITLVTFALLHTVPGDPARMYLGESAQDPQVLAALHRQWGLDRPLPVQYVTYLGNLVHGNMGFSIHSGQAVAKDLAHYLPATAELSLVSFVIAVVIGVPIGVLSGARANSATDHVSRIGSLLFLSMPSFWFGLIVIYIGYYLLGWLPSPTGRLGMMDIPPPAVTGLYTIDTLLARDPGAFWRAVSHLLPPAFTLALPSLGLTVRLVRTSIVEVLSQDFVRTARSKGVAARGVLYRHALRNALIPTVTVLGVQFGLLFSGNILVETVFAWPGLGSYLVQAIEWLDYSAVIGCTVLIAGLFVGVNVLVDFSYAALDPRIHYG